MKFSVTARHIAKGRRWNSTGCPLALCIKETLNKNCSVGIGDCSIDGVTYWLPSSANKFRSEFDFDPRLAKPFTFFLEIENNESK